MTLKSNCSLVIAQIQLEVSGWWGGTLWPCDPEMTCLTADMCQAVSEAKVTAPRPRGSLPFPPPHPGNCPQPHV